MELKLEKISRFAFNVFTLNNKYIGTFELDESGEYKYWDNPNSRGAWSAYQLKAIADKLDEVNKPFMEVVDNYFDEQDLIAKIKSKTFNFTTGFNTSTLMVGDNYHSGDILIDKTAYSIVKYKNKVRVWDKPKNYMAWLNNDKDYILEIDILNN